MTFVYLVFMYVPYHRYKGRVYEGRFLSRPKVFSNYDDAVKFKNEYKHVSIIRRSKLYS